MGNTFAFRAGESIHTESSYKYSIQRFAALARGSGWAPQASWTDAEGMFSVHALLANCDYSSVTGLSPIEIASHAATISMIAVVTDDSISGDRSARTAPARSAADADQVRELQHAVDRVLEQDRADEEQQRPADHAEDRLDVRMAVRMREHQLITDRHHDDAGDDRQMQIGVGQPRKRPVSFACEMFCAPASAPLWK